MKKYIVLSVFAAVTMIVAFMLVLPQSTIGARQAEKTAAGVIIPDSVMKIIQNACMDCHSDDGSSMARSHVNFSKWSTYDAEKQVKKANQICKELKSQGMPPKKWRGNNPDRVPSPTQIATVCNWVNTLQK